MTLENLVRIRQIKKEPPDKKEFEGLVASAINRLVLRDDGAFLGDSIPIPGRK